MIGTRVFVLAGLALGVTALSPAAAQVEDGIVLNILRECSRINDPTARLACYDNNIRAAGGQARASVPGRMDRPSGGGGAVVSSPAQGASSAAGLGSEDLRPSGQAASPSGGPDNLTARVTRVDPREPGVYLLTLADGTQWQFAESVDQGYTVPRDGSSVNIERGALGGYLMRFDQQMGVRVRRVR